MSSFADLEAWGVADSQAKLEHQVPRRWAHATTCIAKARSLAPLVGSAGPLLVATVAVHDIGFSPDLGLPDTSDFPLYDGVRYLTSIGAPDRLVALVANHAGGRIEGELRGYGDRMAGLDVPADDLVRDVQWYCCLTTGPDGENLTFDERVSEWLVRYADDPVMGPFTEQAGPLLRAAVERVERARAASA